MRIRGNIEGMTIIGVVGLGRHGRRYAEHLSRGDVPGASLGGFCRRDSTRGRAEAATLGAPFFDELDALLDAVGAVVLTVPAPEHVALGARIARAGRPLLVEKPLAPSLAEADRLLEAFAGGRLMVAQTLRFDPLVRAVRDMIARDELGALRALSFEQRLEPRGLAWELSTATAGGGVLLQTGIHGLDALRFVVGATQAEVVAADLEHHAGHDAEDAATVRIALSGGAAGARGVRATLMTSKLGASRHHRLSAHGTDAGVEADLVARTLVRVEGRARAMVAVPEVPTVASTLGAFVTWLAEGGDAPVSGADARASLALVEAAYARARRDQSPTGGASR
jgi:UDP-N-acetyl-2-amino-2-deoxyglucuronate dehydrogenase